MGLTPGALVFALVCVVWTGTTAFVSGAVGYLYIKTRRQIDFISLISYVVMIAMLASSSQQIYTIARWDYIKKTQREDSILVAGKTMFFDVGSDKWVKAFYYTQILCYNIAGTLVAFWSFFLWADVWPLQCNWWRSATFSLVTKASTVVLACLLTGISQIAYFSDKNLARFLVGNILLMVFLAVTPIFLVLILYRYIYHRLDASKVLQGSENRSGGPWGIRQVHRFPEEIEHYSSNCSSSSNIAGTGTDAAGEMNSFPKERRANPILDSLAMQIPKVRKTFGTMLLLRFIAAIVVMSGLEIFHVCFQLSRVIGFPNTVTSIKEIPLTTSGQIADTYMFLPSTTQGWLVLVVFGTTEDYWEKFKELVVGIFCFGYARRTLCGCRWRHQNTRATAPGQSSDAIFIDSRSIHRISHAQSFEEGDITIPQPTRGNNPRDNSGRPLPLPQMTNSQSPNRPNYKRGTSLMASMSKPLPHPPRNLQTSNQSGATSPTPLGL